MCHANSLLFKAWTEEIPLLEVVMETMWDTQLNFRNSQNASYRLFLLIFAAG